jgi:hypothetical protein
MTKRQRAESGAKAYVAAVEAANKGDHRRAAWCYGYAAQRYREAGREELASDCRELELIHQRKGWG